MLVLLLVCRQGAGPGGSGLGGAGGASAGGGGGTGNEQLNIQNLQSILQNMGFSAQEQVRPAVQCGAVWYGTVRRLRESKGKLTKTWSLSAEEMYTHR